MRQTVTGLEKIDPRLQSAVGFTITGGEDPRLVVLLAVEVQCRPTRNSALPSHMYRGL